jgi:hypothetical protein
VAVGIAAVSASSLVAFGGAANAATPSKLGKPIVRTAQIDGTAVRAAAKNAGQIGVLSADPARQRIKEHLDEAARSGRLVDESVTHVSSVADPFKKGAQIRLAWDGDKAPEKISYSQADFGGGVPPSTAVGVQFGGGDGPGATEAKAAPSAGSGYGAGFNQENMFRSHNNCADTWFNSGYNSNIDHKITSCFEVWEQNKTVHFVYNRWALWSPAPAPFGISAKTIDFYVASRPWKGKEGNFNQLNDWAPRAPSSACDTKATFDLGGGFGGVEGKVSIPINVCQNYRMDITASTKKVGIDFDGERAGQMYMDVAGDYSAINATVPLTWADYNWVELLVCGPTNCPSQKWVAKDSGW